MIETFSIQGNDDPLQDASAFMAQLMKPFSTSQQALEENVQLKQRVASNVVEQIASLEDASKRDDARRMIEALLKKQQVTQFRRDIKRRVRELNDEGDTYNDEQVTEVLEACVGKGRVVDTKWKWAAVHWYLRWVCNYPVDAKEFCARIQKLELDIPVDYECRKNQKIVGRLSQILPKSFPNRSRPSGAFFLALPLQQKFLFGVSAAFFFRCQSAVKN